MNFFEYLPSINPPRKQFFAIVNQKSFGICLHYNYHSRMASKRVIRSREGGYLIAIIGDEDTATGFLLAGVGDNQPTHGPNYFVVDPSK